VAFAVRTSLGLFGGLGQLVRGRRAVALSGNGWGFLRKLSGFLAITLPWGALWYIYEEGAPHEFLLPGAWFAAVVWLLLRAAVHERVWLDVRGNRVVLQTGFALGSVQVRQVPLDEVFVLIDGQPLPGPEQKSTVETVARQPGWDLLVAQLGTADAAERWARTALVHLGWRAPRTWRVL